MKCVGANGVRKAARGVVVHVEARRGLLIGGVKHHQSSPFCTIGLAKQWARAIRDSHPHASITYVHVPTRKHKK